MPSNNKRSANCCAKGASYNIIGTMGCSPGMISKPAAVMAALKYRVLSSNLSRKVVALLSISNTLMDAPTMAGARVLENKYGLER